MACEVESDFAMSKHIHTYSKNILPTIYSNDSDMLALMCDVDCIVKLTFRKIEGVNYGTGYISADGKVTYFINPVKFWEKIFGCILEPKLIKTLCVLKGTDYNPYSKDSVIHIDRFEDIFKLHGVTKFSELDGDLVLAKICLTMEANPNSIECYQTAIALNMYLSDCIEGGIHFMPRNETIDDDVRNKINVKFMENDIIENEIDIDKFLTLSRRCLWN